MKLLAFAVLDKAAGAYTQPFFQPTRGMAVRMFIDTVADEKSMFSKHPADYALFLLTEYDDVSGRFLDKEPERIMGALDAITGSA